jgi:hypothetical protein
VKNVRDGHERIMREGQMRPRAAALR